jgi:DNA-binding transcriptional MerR regulator
MAQDKYDIKQLWTQAARAMRDFLFSYDFFDFVLKIAKMIGLPEEKHLNLVDFLHILALKGFPVEEARERLDDFLPDLTEEQKEIIIREIAVGFLPILEDLWKITPEDEEYEEKVKRYLSMMEFYLRRPAVRKETALETKPIEETKEEIKMEAEQPQAQMKSQIQETKEEAEQVVLPQEERIITISWEGEKVEEDKKEEKEDDWNIPKIDFKIKKEEIKKEEQEPIDLSQI